MVGLGIGALLCPDPVDRWRARPARRARLQTLMPSPEAAYPWLLALFGDEPVRRASASPAGSQGGRRSGGAGCWSGSRSPLGYAVLAGGLFARRRHRQRDGAPARRGRRRHVALRPDHDRGRAAACGGRSRRRGRRPGCTSACHATRRPAPDRLGRPDRERAGDGHALDRRTWRSDQELGQYGAARIGDRAWRRTPAAGWADGRRPTARGRDGRPAGPRRGADATATGRPPRTAASRSSRAPARATAGSPSTARPSGPRSRRSAGSSATPTCAIGAASSTTGSSSTASSGRSPAAPTARRAASSPEALQATIDVLLTATERGPRRRHLSSGSMTCDDEPTTATRPSATGLARLMRLVARSCSAPPGGHPDRRDRRARRDVRADRLPRPARPSRTSSASPSGGRRPLGRRPGAGLPAAAQADPGRGDGRRPRRRG